MKFLRHHAISMTKGILRRFGAEIQFTKNSLTEEVTLRRVFALRSFDLLIDVGANIGQFARAARSYGYGGSILSFEPLLVAHGALEKAAENDPKWKVHAPVALGAESGIATLHVSANSPSSSLLPMLKSHVAAAPNTETLRTEEVPLETLDRAIDLCGISFSSGYLKIDTQGYELQVLRGGDNTLKKCRAIQVELSMVPLYAGQPLFLDMCNELSARNFHLGYLIPGFRSPAGDVLQFDGIFLHGESPQMRAGMA